MFAAAWCGVAMAICGLTRDLAAFAVASFMIGMAQAVFNLARQSYLTEAVPIEYRARALSTLGGVIRIGMFIGPFFGAAAIHAMGLMGAYVVGVVALLAAGILAARIPDLPTHDAEEHAAKEAAHVAPTVLSTLRDHRAVFLTLGLAVVLVSAVRATRQAMIPLWADHLTLSPSAALLIYGVSGAFDMLVFYPAGKVMDIKGRRWVAVPSMAVMGAALLLTPMTTGVTTLLLAAAAIGFGNGIGSGMVMTLGADHAPRTGRAHFLGLWRLMQDLGGTFGPALLSLLTASLSLGGAITVMGFIAFVAAVQLACWIPNRPPGI